MDDETRRTIDDFLGPARSTDLVNQFRSLLVEVGVVIKLGSRGKYFLAAREEQTVFLLAHESSSQVFLGVLRTLVEELQRTAAVMG